MLGAGLAGTAAWVVSADEAWGGLVIPCVIIALTVLLPIVLVVRSFTGVAGGGGGGAGFGFAPAEAEVQAAATQGRLALARVKAIRRTGTSINDQPVCDLDLVVVPRFGAPFEVRTRRLVDLVEIPRLQPESVVVVITGDQVPSSVSIVMNPPDDWVQQAQSDEQVRSVRTAPPFTPATDPTSSRSGLRRIPRFVYLAGILVGAAVALIPAYPTIAALATGDTTLAEVRHASSYEGKAEAEQRAQAEADAAANMFVGDNAARAVEALTNELGATQVTQLSFWATNLSAVAQSAPGDGTLDDFTVSGGEVERSGAASTQLEPGELELQLFDASAVDYSLMPALIEQAKELSQLQGADPDGDEQSVYVARKLVSGFDVPQIVFDVPISGEYYDAWFTFSATGEVLSMRGGTPGSASYEAEHAGH